MHKHFVLYFVPNFGMKNVIRKFVRKIKNIKIILIDELLSGAWSPTLNEIFKENEDYYESNYRNI